MRIKRIKIKNYRSFDNNGVDIEFPEIQVPISLVGHNNSGKTNFINALLYGTGSKTVNDNTFNRNDFHLHSNKDILVEVEIDPPLKSSDAYNHITEMPILKLIAKYEDGIVKVSHYCYDNDGKSVYNAKALKRTKSKVYSDDEKEILNEALKKGAETVSKWKSKIPIYYLEPTSIFNQLRVNRYTLLGKVILELKADFERLDNLVPDKPGIVQAHKGKPRIEIFEKGLKYIEEKIIPTEKLEDLIERIQLIIKEQLEIESDDFSLNFGLPTIDSFYDNLEFYVKDNATKPKLPLKHLGNGFISLFVIALLRAIIESGKGGNIFIIEEPETFLHEHFQEYFYSILCNLSKNNQVIYSTHSKKFVNLFKPKSILRFENPEYLKSTIKQTKIDIAFPDSIDNFKLVNPSDFPKYLKSLEPNIGNIIFSKKVIIVEGPHDILAYKTILNLRTDLSLHNISIVAAWGKDPILLISKLCKEFSIPFYIIHDWDMEDSEIDVSIDSTSDKSEYSNLDSDEKAQYTKNHKLLIIAGSKNIHQNKKNLEAVLGIEKKDKGAMSVFEKIGNKSIDEIKNKFPKLISDSLFKFVE